MDRKYLYICLAIAVVALIGSIFCEPGSEGRWNGRLMLETTNGSPYPVKLFPGVLIVKGIFIKI